MSGHPKTRMVGRPLHKHGLRALPSEWGEFNCNFCGRRLSERMQAALIGECSHLLASIIKKEGEKNNKN